MPVFWSTSRSFVLLFQLAEMVNLHFLSLIEALQECNSSVLYKLFPMWLPVFHSQQTHVFIFCCIFKYSHICYHVIVLFFSFKVQCNCDFKCVKTGNRKKRASVTRAPLTARSSCAGSNESSSSLAKSKFRAPLQRSSIQFNMLLPVVFFV